MVTAVSTSITTALGYGSGIDTVKLVSDLAAAVNGPKEAAITARTESNTAATSALGQAASGIDNFASALSSLIAGGSLFTQPTTSDSSVIGASALPGARLAGLSASIEVKALAQSQTLASGYFASSAAVVGNGALTLTVGNATVGSNSFDITIDETNNTLGGIARAINAKNAGVTATVVTDTQGARLVLKGQTGEAKAFTVTAAEGSDAGLSALSYDPGAGGGMELKLAAQDAVVVVDGVEVRRSTNSISDLVPGVKLDLKRAAIGTSVSLGFNRPTDAISQAVNDFVGAYNELKDILDTATAPKNADGTGGGALRGDLGIQTMQRMLAKLPTTVLNSAGGVKTLAEIGVKTNRDGTLAVDSAVLASRLASDPDGVEALFNPTQYASTDLIQITSAMGKTKPGTYTLTNLTPQVGSTAATGSIAGLTAISSGASLIAAADSTAVGLVVKPLGTVASATVTVDPGLGGVLQALRDALRGRNGPLATSQTSLQKQAEKIADDQAKQAARSQAYTDRLTQQFTQMDKLVSSYKSTESYLKQQFEAWNSSNN